MASFQLDDIGAPALTDPTDLKEPTVVIEAADSSASSSTDKKGPSTEDWVYPHPTDFKISEHPIDEVRKLRVWTIWYLSLIHI